MSVVWFEPTKHYGVSINKQGISFGSGVHKELGSPAFIKIGFDGDNLIIACSFETNHEAIQVKKIRGQVRIAKRPLIMWIEGLTGMKYLKSTHYQYKIINFNDRNAISIKLKK